MRLQMLVEIVSPAIRLRTDFYVRRNIARCVASNSKALPQQGAIILRSRTIYIFRFHYVQSLAIIVLIMYKIVFWDNHFSLYFITFCAISCRRVLFYENKFLSLRCWVTSRHIESVFALSLIENVAIFDEERTTDNTHFLFRSRF